MEKYRLGKTELMVSEIGFGGIPISRIPREEAVKVILQALEYGINFIDTANAYKDSEEKIGFALKGKREEVIIATKSSKRNKQDLLNDIDNSLKMLQTDHIDLFQIHQVSNDEEYNEIFEEDGAFAGALEALKDGKILHLGITSHRFETAMKLIQTDKFETIQFGANFIETEAIEELFPEAVKRDLGCIVMKPLGGGELCNARLCFRYLQQWPGYIPIPGVSDIKELKEIVNLYTYKKAITEDEIQEIDKIRNAIDRNFCRRCAYCEPCPRGVKVFAGMAIERVIRNFGANYNAEWFLDGVKSIDFCVECGRCEERCPYHLPIRETLKKNKKFYEDLTRGLPSVAPADYNILQDY